MKYTNVTTVLPDTLIQEPRKYVQAGYTYIPAKDEQYKFWGELSGCRKELGKCSKAVIEKRRNGVSTEEPADEYYPSVYAIRRIICQK